MKRTCRRHHRRGASLVLVALLIVPLVAMLAFAVDLGYLMMAQTQLQTSADSAALAACWELVDENALGGTPNATVTASNARTKASEYAAYNPVCAQAPTINQNASNAATGDVLVGYLANLSDPTANLVLTTPQYQNAVTVKVRRDLNQNGQVPFWFGRVLGLAGIAAEADATAALVYGSIKGFQSPGDGTNLDLLPFALDIDTWNSLSGGGCGSGGTDSFRWNPSTGTVSSGSDGVDEVNLYPQGTGSPGNRGTVDIGSCNNSTNDIARQIVSGINANDLSYHGGKLEFDAQGKLYLNGDTGISAGVKDELTSIIGKPRVIPIFNNVTGPGNNATYTIVKFVGVRIMEVQLTGSMSSKRVIIQPANVVAKGAIPGNTQGTTSYVYSPVRLVR